MKSTILGLLAVGLLAGSSASFAATQLVGGGTLTGATGVVVGGQLYNVVFAEGTCADVFGGCDAASDFAFIDYGDALAASQALLDQVLLDTALGSFDSSPFDTFGCATSAADDFGCQIYTPYSLDLYNGGPGVYGVRAVNKSPSVGTDGLALFAVPVTYSTTPAANLTWAVWMRVPEPGTLALLGLGLAGLGLSRRRKAN